MSVIINESQTWLVKSFFNVTHIPPQAVYIFPWIGRICHNYGNTDDLPCYCIVENWSWTYLCELFMWGNIILCFKCGTSKFSVLVATSDLIYSSSVHILWMACSLFFAFGFRLILWCYLIPKFKLLWSMLISACMSWSQIFVSWQN